MLMQCSECTVAIIATLLLGGYTGAIVTLIALIRNIISAVGKTSKTSTIILIATSVVLSIVNANTLLDILPAIASIEYTLALYKNNVKITKIAFAINAFLWTIYDITIGAWVYVIFNIINIAICLYEVQNLRGLSTE